MECHVCGQPAVGICRWCQVALCRVHLAQSLAAHARPVMGCDHSPQTPVKPPPGA